FILGERVIGVDDTENVLSTHTRQIGELGQRVSKHGAEIQGLKESDIDHKKLIRRIEDKLDRPPWSVTIMITLLSSLVVGLSVYIITTL
ncbi:MAG: hypothetical protein WD037_05820, partial [Balneolales bacterium]